MWNRLQIEEMNICIEFNGVQHDIWIKFFQPTLHDFYKQKHHDWLKRKYCRNNKIRLITLKKPPKSAAEIFSN